MDVAGELTTLITSIARELADALRTGLVTRGDRSQARKILMEAWLVGTGDCAEKDTRTRAQELIRAMDDLLARSRCCNGNGPTIMESVTESFPDPVRVRTAADHRQWSHTDDLEKFHHDILRRTQTMVNRSQASQEMARTTVRVSEGTGPGMEGREELELVRDETED